MTQDKTIVLVTGANGGIGFELVAQLAAKGTYHVLLGARSKDKGEAAVKELQSRNYPGTIELLQIDCNDDASIAAAFKTVEDKFGRLDVLVQNAAIAVSSKATLREQMIDCFNTNAAGLAVIGYTFAPLLGKGKTPRMISVSSGAGSIAERLAHNDKHFDKGEEWVLPYRTSKTAENMVTAHLAYGLRVAKSPVKTFTYCPGFTASNLSHMNKVENGAKPTAEGVYPLVDIIEGKRDAEADGFLHEGGQYGW